MDVWTKLEANAYRNRDPYPERPRKPVLSKDATPAQIRAYADALEAYDSQLVEYRALVAAWNAHSVALEGEFRRDLEITYDMVGHPKADLLYDKAYEKGHSGGMQEVANYYSDLVELVK